MGAIVHIPETLDVICQHNHDGTMIPLKIRLIDEDGEYATAKLSGAYMEKIALVFLID